MSENTYQDSNCDFCREFTRSEDSRFSSIYAGVLESREVWANREFVVLPTLGQLLKGSLLIMPRMHVERFADLSSESRSRVQVVLAELEKSFIGPSIVFEHGAKYPTGGGCGIFHAHIHLVPVPNPISINDILPRRSVEHATLIETWRDNECTEEYLIVGDTDGRFASLDRAAIQELGVTSQFMRRFLVNHFGIPRSWDWRAYDQPEKELIQIVNEWRLSNVP
jgi:diadenosine tetraphosphate (Ap4A) HIT family hydrolase